jgi:hypothetical protein
LKKNKIIDDHFFQSLNKKGKNNFKFKKRFFLGGSYNISFEIKIINEYFFQKLSKEGKEKVLCFREGAAQNLF